MKKHAVLLLLGYFSLACSYPNYPNYVGGPADQVSSYVSIDRKKN